MSHFNCHFLFDGGLEMTLNLRDQVRKYPIWFSKVKPEWLFSFVLALMVTWEVLIFWRTPLHHSDDIHRVCVCVCVCVCVYMCVCVCAFRECLTFSQWAGFTQKLCHTSPIPLIAGQRLAQDRQRLLLDLCVIKYLFGKISQGILGCNRHSQLLKSELFQEKRYYFL